MNTKDQIRQEWRERFTGYSRDNSDATYLSGTIAEAAESFLQDALNRIEKETRDDLVKVIPPEYTLDYFQDMYGPSIIAAPDSKKDARIMRDTWKAFRTAILSSLHSPQEEEPKT